MNDNFTIPPHRTISQVIEELQKIQTEHGDLPICTLYEENGGFCFDFDQIFEMVELADEYPTAEENDLMKTVKVCAFTYPEEPESFLKVVTDE